MAWRNGLGETTEIVVEPARATLGDFDWRLSMARIDAAGPFSKFPNVDRLLMVLEGRLHLAIEGRGLVELTPHSVAVSFPGELGVTASLPAAEGTQPKPVTDLNLMVRRGHNAARIRRLLFEQHTEFQPTADIAVLLCCTPGLLVVHEAGTDQLQRHDALIIDGPESRPFELSHTGNAVVYIVEITHLRPGRI